MMLKDYLEIKDIATAFSISFYYASIYHTADRLNASLDSNNYDPSLKLTIQNLADSVANIKNAILIKGAVR